jgi:hypothetical protein
VDTDELYGLPLDRFVPERTALARALRAAGRRDEAAEVAALRKPSVAAWAVNQLVRTQRQGVIELFESGDRLLAAHHDALSGRGDAGALRAASEHEREAVDALVQAARGLLTSDGHELSGVVIDRVAETLHAAALDEEARDSTGAGRLVRELRHVGLGVATPADATPETPARARTARAAPATKRRTTKQRSRQVAGDREAAARAHAARAAEAETRRQADRAARRVELAEQRRARAAKELRGAEEALSAARAEADAAADAHRRAEQQLRRA